MTEARRILIVEDNEDLAYGLKNNLEVQGYVVETAANGNTALRCFRQGAPDLIVLDLMLPDIGGIDVLRKIRRSDTAVPVLILTAKGSEVDKVMGLRLGADDYVTKPFALMELLARVEALLRRSKHTGDASERELVFGDLRILTETRSIERAGKTTPLTHKEFGLLMALIRRHGKVASRVELMKEVWGYSSAVVSRTVDTHIADLRRKIEQDPARPAHILTIRKAGYRWQLQ
tara:strand:- start:12 stop:707 length:696 start_codon:yes stop_codon:yes gene_type:complete